MVDRMKIVVLADGETFGAATGCRVIEVPDSWDTDDIEMALAGDDDEGRLDLSQTTVIITDIESAVEPLEEVKED